MFNFEVRYIPGKKHTTADSLSRRPTTEAEREEEAMEGDIDDWPDELLFEDRTLEFGSDRATTQPPSTQLDVCPAGIALDSTETKDSEAEDLNTETESEILEAGYSKDSIRIAIYLKTLHRPTNVSSEDFQGFKKRALRFAVRNHQL